MLGLGNVKDKRQIMDPRFSTVDTSQGGTYGVRYGGGDLRAAWPGSAQRPAARAEAGRSGSRAAPPTPGVT